MLCSSSLLDWISSLADRSSSLVVLCSSMIDWRYSRVASSSSFKRLFSTSRRVIADDAGGGIPMQQHLLPCLLQIHRFGNVAVRPGVFFRLESGNEFKRGRGLPGPFAINLVLLIQRHEEIASSCNRFR